MAQRLRSGYDNLVWMKLSEIARYCAAKELTRIESTPSGIRFNAPFGCPRLTVSLTAAVSTPPKLNAAPLAEVSSPQHLGSGTWTRQSPGIIACLDLPKGESILT